MSNFRNETAPMQIAASAVERSGWLGLAEAFADVTGPASTVADNLKAQHETTVIQAAVHLLIARFFDPGEVVPPGAALVVRMPDGSIRERS